MTKIVATIISGPTSNHPGEMSKMMKSFVRMAKRIFLACVNGRQFKSCTWRMNAFVALVAVFGTPLSNAISSEFIATNEPRHTYYKTLQELKSVTEKISKSGVASGAVEEKLLQLRDELTSVSLFLAAKEDQIGELHPLVKQTSEARERSHQVVTDKLNKLMRLGVSKLNANKHRAGVRTSRKISLLLAGLNEQLNQLAPTVNSPIIGNSVLPVTQLDLFSKAFSDAEPIVPSYTQQVSPIANAEDLQQSDYVTYTEELLTLAESLNHDPVKIYEYVRNHIETEWYYGVKRTPTAVFHDKRGNDIEQSALLVALLRLSGIPARFVTGVAELPRDSIKNQLNLDINESLEALRKAGFAIEAQYSGHYLANLKVESTWVSAYVPYSNYRGAPIDDSGKTWLPLAPWVKQYHWGHVLPSDSVPYGEFEDLLVEPSVEVNARTVRETIDDRIRSLLARTPNPKSLEEYRRLATIQTETLDLLPSSLPFSVARVLSESDRVLSKQFQKLDIKIYRSDSGSEVITTKQFDIYRLLSKKFTLSYRPYAKEDFEIVNAFGGLNLVPPHLVNLTPEMYIGDVKVFSSDVQLEMGSQHRIDFKISNGAYQTEASRHVRVGDITAIQLSDYIPETTYKNDEVLTSAADYLSDLANQYLNRWYNDEIVIAAYTGVKPIRALPSLVLVSNQFQIANINGQIEQMSWKGVNLDVVSHPISMVSYSPYNVDDQLNTYLAATAMAGSQLESRVFIDAWGVDSVSAEKVLASTNAENIVEVDSTNNGEIETLLTLNDNVIEDIRRWVQNGFSVKTSKENITLNDWVGAAWIVSDENGIPMGYFMSGGIAGGATAENPTDWEDEQLVSALLGSYADAPNKNPASAVSIFALPSSKEQIVTVGQEAYRKVSFIVLDIDSRPVQDALVDFSVRSGGGHIVTDSGNADRTIIKTNRFGVASVNYQAGTDTSIDSVYIYTNESDVHLTKASQQIIDASVEVNSGISFDQVTLFAIPDTATSLVRKNAQNVLKLADSVDTVLVELHDQYGNTVSNQPISIAAVNSTMNCPELDHVQPLSTSVRTYQEPCESCYTNTAEMISAPYPVWVNIKVGASAGSIQAVDISAENISESRFYYLVPFGRSEMELFSYASTILPEGAVSWPSRILINDAQSAESEPFTSALDLAHSGQYNASILLGKLCVGEQTDWTDAFTPFYEYKRNVDSLGREHLLGNTGEELRNAYSVTIGYDRATFTVGQKTDGQGNTVYSKEYTGETERVLRAVDTQIFDTEGLEVTEITQIEEERIFSVLLADAPTVHRVWAEFDDLPITDYAVESLTGTVSTIERSMPGFAMKFDLPTAYAAILNMSIEPSSDGEVELKIGKGAASVEDINVNYSLLTADTPIGAVHLLLYQDGELIEFFESNVDTSNGRVTIPRGRVYDFESTYELEFVMNWSLESEIRSAREEIPVELDILHIGTNQLRISQDVDVPNEQTCSVGGSIWYELIDDANVEVSYWHSDQVDLSAWPPNLEEQQSTRQILESANSLVPGEHSFSLLVSDTGPGNYVIQVAAERISTGDVYYEYALLDANYNLLDSLPAGHTIIEGVDIFDGHLISSAEDFSMTGRGPDLRFNRTYSSKAISSRSTLGVGWSHNFDVSLRENPCGWVSLSGGDATGARFYPDQEGGYIASKGHFGSLVYNAESNTFDYFNLNGDRLHYTYYEYPKHGTVVKEWRLLTITDTNSNVLKLGYAPGTTPLLMLVEDNGGRTLQFEYEQKTFLLKNGGNNAISPVINTVSDFLLSRVSGPQSVSVQFAYDNYGNLAQVKREYDLRVETYAYGTESDVTQTHLLTKYTNPLGGEIDYVYEYSDIGAITSVGKIDIPTYFVKTIQRDATTVAPESLLTFDYDSDGLKNRTTDTLVATVTNGRGFETTYTMDKYGSVTLLEQPYTIIATTWDSETHLVDTIVDGRGTTTSYQYDDFGNVTEKKTEGAETFITSYTYAALGNESYIRNRIKTKTDSNQHVSIFDYDSAGNLLSEKNGEGNETKYAYYENGDLKYTESPNGFRTDYLRYDDNGYLLLKRWHAGPVDRQFLVEESMLYNDLGQMVSHTSPRGIVTAYEYDSLGRQLKILKPYDVDTLSVKPNGHTIVSEYNALSSKTSESIRFNDKQLDTVWEYDTYGKQSLIRNALLDTKDFRYDENGNIIEEIDWNRNSTYFEYDEQDRLVETRKPLGVVATMAYDENNNVVSNVDPLQREIQYEYDDFNNKVKQTMLLAGDEEWADFTGNIEKTWKYDGEGNLLEEKNTRGFITYHQYDKANRLLKSWRDRPNGTRWETTNEYDDNGNKVLEIDPNGVERRTEFSADNLPTTMFNGLGYSTDLFYDEMGRLTKIVDALDGEIEKKYNDLGYMVEEIISGYGLPVSIVTKYEYDAAGNMVKEILPNGNEVIRQYDVLNRLVRADDNLGQLEVREYDANGNLRFTYDQSNIQRENVYDALNRLVRSHLPEGRTIEYGYDFVGNVISEKDAEENETNFSYTNFDKVWKQVFPEVIDPESNLPVRYETKVKFDQAANETHVIDAKGNTTINEYDDFNRTVRVTSPAPFNYETTYTYDVIGNLIESTNPRNVTSKYKYDNENQLLETEIDGLVILTTEYDPIGRPSRVTDANANESQFSYDARGQLTVERLQLSDAKIYAYDAMGDVIYVEDSDGVSTVNTYDVRRRLETTTVSGVNEVTLYKYDDRGNNIEKVLPEQNIVRMNYDDANRLTHVYNGENDQATYTYYKNDLLQSQTLGLVNSTSYQYDALNRKSLTTYADLTTETLVYDANGNVIKSVDQNGQEIVYQFDELNRMSVMLLPQPIEPTGDDVTQISYSYDQNGNMTQVTESYSGATSLRTSTMTYDAFDRLKTKTDPFTHWLRYTYDDNGNRIRLNSKSGHYINYVYDQRNRVSSVIFNNQSTLFGYTKAGRLSAIERPNSLSTQVNYDDAGRIETIAHSAGDTLVRQFTYTYDDNSNRKSTLEYINGANELTSYNYDLADRLLDVTYPDFKAVYTYDDASNRESEQHFTLSDQLTTHLYYSYNNRNELEQINDVLAGTVHASYQYDDNGNTTQKTSAGQTFSYAYDARNKLQVAKTDGLTVGTYKYGYAGQRFQKNADTEIERYVLDGTSVFQVLDENSAVKSTNIYGARNLLSRQTGGHGNIEYYIHDVMSSVVAMLDDDATVAASYQFDAWGNYRSNTGASTNQFGYTGHRHDDETGLIYAKARYYDPAAARFLSQDAYLGSQDTPPSLHRYLYAYANPLKYSDPTGNVTELAMSEVDSLHSAASRNSGMTVRGGSSIARFAYSAGYVDALPAAGQFSISSSTVKRLLDRLDLQNTGSIRYLIVEKDAYGRVDTDLDVADYLLSNEFGDYLFTMEDFDSIRIPQGAGGVVDISVPFIKYQQEILKDSRWFFSGTAEGLTAYRQGLWEGGGAGAVGAVALMLTLEGVTSGIDGFVKSIKTASNDRAADATRVNAALDATSAVSLSVNGAAATVKAVKVSKAYISRKLVERATQKREAKAAEQARKKRKEELNIYQDSPGHYGQYQRNTINQHVIDEIFSINAGTAGAKVQAQRILLGGNGKIAIIGRPMGAFTDRDTKKYVHGLVNLAQELNRRGFTTELFAGGLISKQSRREFAGLTNLPKKYKNEFGEVRANKLSGTIGFYENKAWAEKLRNEGYTVIDIGNLYDRFSIYYASEKRAIFNNSTKRRTINREEWGAGE